MSSGGHIYLYGPPGSGKTSIGRILADCLDLPFVDLDDAIETGAGCTIPEIMAGQGEPAFRELESAALAAAASRPAGLIALGGGALLRESNRALAEASGRVVFLEASPAVLLERLGKEAGRRPLLAGEVEEKLSGLLERRRSHYESFTMRVVTNIRKPEELAWDVQRLLGRFRVCSPGAEYDVIVRAQGQGNLGELLKERQLDGPVALVADANVAKLYGVSVEASISAAGYPTHLISFPAGEANKTLQTVTLLWEQLLAGGLDRRSTVVALGGGVTGDLSGFAASTFMRGIAWVAVPTSLLAMADACLGGKTGFDLPYGKNLVGSFHSPRLVLADPDCLKTLPETELRSGLAEVVKHGVLGDPELFDLCSAGMEAVRADLDTIVRTSMAVKIRVIQADPFEQGARAALNYGHTLGHAVELASGYRLKHGEAVSIGMVAEARLAERLGLAERGLSERIAATLAGLGLPVLLPADLPRKALCEAMQMDKKKRLGRVRFALPVRIGEVKADVEVDDLNRVFEEG